MDDGWAPPLIGSINIHHHLWSLSSGTSVDRRLADRRQTGTLGRADMSTRAQLRCTRQHATVTGSTARLSPLECVGVSISVVWIWTRACYSLGCTVWSGVRV
jgi:hypothetical protein